MHNSQHIQSWALQRNFRLSKRAIEVHKIRHYGYFEKTEPINEIEFLAMTLGQIESLLNLNDDELLNYLEANNLKPNRIKKYDLIDVLQYFTNQLSNEVDLLQQKLKELTPNSQKLAMSQLKQEKLEAETRLLTALAQEKELELSLALGELIQDLQLEQQWGYGFVKFKSKLESLPSKAALELSAIPCESDVRNLLNKSIVEAVSELDYGS